MILTAPEVRDALSAEPSLRVVLCGSFRRTPAALRQVHERLSAEFVMLSPIDVQFVDPTADFVRLAHEVDSSAQEIEDRHLAAITAADFVWLCAPDGYVGPSASLELGHARALGVPVFASQHPADEMINSYVTVVGSPSDVPSRLKAAPGQGLSGLQAYYARIAARRGWSAESPSETMLLITEEIGELAREVRKASGLSRDHSYRARSSADGLESEIADVQLYLVHLANMMGVDIAEAVTAKETVNEERHLARRRANVA